VILRGLKLTQKSFDHVQFFLARRESQEFHLLARAHVDEIGSSLQLQLPKPHRYKKRLREVEDLSSLTFPGLGFSTKDGILCKIWKKSRYARKATFSIWGDKI
jgi:hypothetical protein